MDDAHTITVLLHACYCGNELHAFDKNLLASTTLYLEKDDKSTDVCLEMLPDVTLLNLIDLIIYIYNEYKIHYFIVLLKRSKPLTEHNE